MNKIKNKKGFTLAEALVAMLLVAIMAAGIIVALMSTKRAIVSPTNREEMLLAVEEVSSILQTKRADGDNDPICGDDSYSGALDLTPGCSAESSASRANCHSVGCKKPTSCSGDGDYFVYSVFGGGEEDDEQEQRYITFMISCEGQTI